MTINPLQRMLNAFRFTTANPRRMRPVILVFCVLSALHLEAQTISRVGTTAAPFLKIGVGARALAMGEAYVTQAEDVTALFWNPAGLARLDGVQILLNHYAYLADMSYEFGGVSVSLGNMGTFGFFFSYLGMPDIDRTTIQYPDGNGEKVSANSFATGFSYARALTDRFSFGGNIKLVRETIWHSRATGMAFDLGLLYRTFFKNVRIGMNISNFGGDLGMDGRDMLIQHDIDDTFSGNNENINGHLDTERYPLPVLFRVGLSANIARDFLNMNQTDWIVSIDAVHPNDNKEHINVGTEIKLMNFVAMRAGYRQLLEKDREGGFTFGFGLNLNLGQYRAMLDFANVDFGRLDHANKFSLIFTL